MGGLITSYYLRYGSQAPEEAVETWEGASHIDKVVLATVPFKGSMTAFHNMKHGARFGLNTTLIKAQAFATFPSVYEMMPTYAPVLLDGRLNPLPYTLYESKLWERYGWGFLNTATRVSGHCRGNPPWLPSSDTTTRVSEHTRQKRLALVTTALCQANTCMNGSTLLSGIRRHCQRRCCTSLPGRTLRLPGRFCSTLSPLRPCFSTEMSSLSICHNSPTGRCLKTETRRSAFSRPNCPRPIRTR